MQRNTKSPSDPAPEVAEAPREDLGPDRRELALATGGLLALLLLLDLLGQFVGWVGSNLLVFVAATFLLLPDLIWPAGRADPLQADRPRREQLRGVGIGLTVGLAVLLAFLPGYHLWTTRASERTFAPSAAALRQPANELGLRPRPASESALRIERDGRDLLLHWRPETTSTLTLASDGRLQPVTPARPEAGTSLAFTASPDRPLAARLRVSDATTVEGTVSPPTAVALGSDNLEASDAFRIAYDYRWLGWMLLMQVVLVAIPEETFFRGYLMRRLARWRPERDLGRFLHVSRANLLASATFAAAHFVIGFHPARLAVFFPSLLFGRLAERTGGLAASVTLHVLSNLMMQVATTQYLP